MPQNQPVKRKIHFFQIFEENCKFDDVLKELNNLRGHDMYSEIGNDRRVYIQKCSQQSGCLQGSMSTLKMSDFPNRGTFGERDYEPLGLNDNQGLVDQTHFSYFPETKILMFEYNFACARANALERYINEKLCMLRGIDTKEHVQIKPILSKEFMDKLNKIGEVKTFTMQVPVSRAGDLEAIDESLPDAIDALARIGDTDEVEVVFRKKPRSKNSIFKDPALFIESLIGMFNRISPSETFHKAIVKAENKQTGLVEEFDLLQDKIESEVRTIKLGNTRSVDSEDIFSKMKDIYEQRRPELKQLLTVDE